MRTVAFVAVFLALAGIGASEPALAGGKTRVSVGVGFGFGYPYWGGPWGPWGPWGYPYYPPVQTIVVPAQPVTYIEQPAASTPAATTAAPDRWWYYCDSSRGYYPYVKECPAGWQRVAPAPSQ
jgi:hypothetical protein